ncbi:hypothetical protein MNBD_PLANCTO02-1419 [hydrothermal vent metagenome]|uniref:Uncharacterized protein n=1 Tax=hydrothermal vent metagenome TaxID=652676 RepID=A0A3B1E915_9ZZZZ
MQKILFNNRSAWIAFGLLAGVVISYIVPQQKAEAITTDRDSKFALATTKVNFETGIEGIFVLDFLTGQIKGSILDTKAGKFNHAYFRNVAVDFNIDPKAKPHYAIVSGKAPLRNLNGVSMAQSVIYVAELTSGKVLCYAYPYGTSRNKVAPVELVLLDGFQFREAIGN